MTATERLVLLVVGLLVTAAGAASALLRVLPDVVRFGLALSVVVTGAGVCVLALRPAASRAQDDSPAALLAVERLALLPVAVLVTLGGLVVLFDGGLAWAARLPVVLASVALGGLLWVMILRRRPAGRPVR